MTVTNEERKEQNIKCVAEVHAGITKIHNAVRTWLFFRDITEKEIEEILDVLSLELIGIEQILESFGLITEYKEYKRIQASLCTSED